MATQKQVVHFQAKKGFTTAQSNEHQRRWTEKGWAQANENGRIDRSRTHLNFEIVRGGKIQPVDKSRSIPEIFREGGEAAFRQLELETLRTVLDEADAAGTDTVLALGGGALTLPQAREFVFSRTRCVWLRTRLDTIRQRLGAADASRPLFADADALYASREPLYAQAPFVVDTDGKSPADVADEIVAVLR